MLDFYRLVQATGRLLLASLLVSDCAGAAAVRERRSINSNWKFARFESNPDSLSYNASLAPWILPSANDYIIDGTHHRRPDGIGPGSKIDFVQASFDDSGWETLRLPHDWAVKGPFGAPGISGGMGRLPSNGVGWYRRHLSLAADTAGKTLFLDVDGAMSHSAVWLNGALVGGWPNGYTSFRLDLTPYAKTGEDNLLAIRLDNARNSSRWYPGAGLYRNVWLTAVDPVHVAYSGTYITTPRVAADEATISLAVRIQNTGQAASNVSVETEIRVLGSADAVATFPRATASVAAGEIQSVNGSTTVARPLLWGPQPNQTANRYVAVTSLIGGHGAVLDTYETRFGIRSVDYDANQGLLVNGQKVRVQGTNNHHDLGGLGAAFHTRAAERQLELLLEMGCNALRMSHNPPAPELLDLADSMGFVVIDEVFDVWKEKKVDDDYHLLFADWHEPDLRSFVRRDANHPSVIAWSIGNEIREQETEAGGETGRMLRDMAHQEDPTRPVTSALNRGKPGQVLPGVLDVISLNYQGEGMGTTMNSSFPGFHERYPAKMIWTSESASTVSTRGAYLFPVVGNYSQTLDDRPGNGANSSTQEVSAYELYAPEWASSPDKVFDQQDRHAYVAGEFVWTGWDYLGEPTPYDGASQTARSSYFGILDTAGFKKDRFFLYQARWAPDVPMAHMLPHWTWPDRVGKVTPVHVFSAADTAELFVNGVSQGKLDKAPHTYRFRWDSVTYAPGEVRVVTYKDGAPWAEASMTTVGAAAALHVTADRATIAADESDLAFVRIAVVDAAGHVVPEAGNAVTFSLSGPGEIVATDNGNPVDQTPFPSLSRDAFKGLALAIVRSRAGEAGEITVTAAADGLRSGNLVVLAKSPLH